ncbi:MAG: FAD-binding oxidoreductase, partial [Chloroflexia bacterium]
YGGFDFHPALIARVVNNDDIAQVITFARETGLELAVRSGGHSLAGFSGTEGGIVLDLSEMKGIKIDPESRTAWVEPGLTAEEFAKATGEYNLAVGFGDTGSVAVGGITTGGGVGYMVRKYGLTIDSLLAADIVTADSKLHHISETSEPDLFWAIRGGGGNFGVVTRFKFQLQDVSNVYGGMIILPATPEVISGFVAASEAAPEELGAIANVMRAFPAPFLPEDVVGKLIVMGMIVYLGDPEEGEKAIAPFRALATPYADMIKPMKYAEIYPPEDEDGPHILAVSHTMYVNKVDLPVARLIYDRLPIGPGIGSVAQLRVLGGKMARIPEDATAFALRKQPIMVNVASLYADPATEDKQWEWVNLFAADLNQGDNSGYVNFLNPNDGRIRDAYPGPTYDRLSKLKRQYDPTNLFHRNQNIEPAGE